MTRDAPAPSGGAWEYRPALDGLRSVAVYLVVAFHAGVATWNGGFIGVDLFFVLSGFLVTSVLLAEQRRAGRIRLGRFYARRVRRLLPAAIVTIVAVAVAAVFVEPPLTRAGHVADARWALLYVSNWHFVSQATDYFAQDVHGSPYLHFWSLSVEEQFYLAFPLVLIGLLALGRRLARPSTLLIGVGVLLIAAVAAQAYWADRDPLRAYYGTDARVYQMLAGALLAVGAGALRARTAANSSTVARPVAWATSAVALAALIAVATDIVDWSPSTRGYAAALTSVLLIASLEAAARGPVGRLLARPSLVYLGRISYGTYLWHWPIIVFARQILDLSAVALAVLATVGATALASLSYTLLETPVRTSGWLGRRPWPVVATGLATSVLAATLIAPTILESDRRPVVSAAGVGSAGLGVGAAVTPTSTTTTTTPADPIVAPAAPTTAAPPAAPTTVGPTTVPLDQLTVPPDIDLAEAAKFTTGQFSCLDAAPEECILVNGAGPHLLLLGDSNAAMMVPMFRQLAEDHDFTFSAITAAGCTWQRDLSWEVEDRTMVDTCLSTRDDAYERVIPALQPDVVVTMHVSRDDPARPSPPFVPLDESLGSGDAAVAEATIRSLDALEALGARVLLIDPVPYGRFDTVQCLSGVDLVIDCAFQTSDGPSAVELVYREQAAQRPGVVFHADLDPLVCPLAPLCLPILDGELVFRDALHVYPPWLVDHREDVWSLLTATGATG